MIRILFIALLLGSSSLNSQTNSKNVENHQLKVNLVLTPNIDYEIGISKHSTLDFQLGTEIAGLETQETGDINLGLFPMLRMSFRQYYNFERRKVKERNTNNNSANYFGFTSNYINTNPIIITDNVEIADSYVFNIGVTYGLQRTYFNKLNLLAEIGVGYGYTDASDGQIIPILNFNLGWIIL